MRRQVALIEIELRADDPDPNGPISAEEHAGKAKRAADDIAEYVRQGYGRAWGAGLQISVTDRWRGIRRVSGVDQL